MIISEIEVDTPEEWLSVLIELEEKVVIMNMVERNKWYIKSGMCIYRDMTKKGWYVQVLAKKKNNDEKDL